MNVFKIVENACNAIGGSNETHDEINGEIVNSQNSKKESKSNKASCLQV